MVVFQEVYVYHCNNIIVGSLLLRLPESTCKPKIMLQLFGTVSTYIIKLCWDLLKLFLPNLSCLD